MLFEVLRAENMFLYGPNRTRIMDLISGINVSMLGHCHPKVVQAIQKQSAAYMHTMVYGEFVHEATVRLAKKLASLLPDALQTTYFVNSGTEAIEGAIKLAKKVTGRYEIVSAATAYHGSSHAAVSLMSEPTYKYPFLPMLPGHRYIQFNDFEDLERINRKTAAVICEPIQAEGGLIGPKKGYLMAVRKRCDEVGALLVLDEIQTFCRTGNHFAFEKYGIVPDIITLAKGLGGGMPIGVFISRLEWMNRLANQPALGHINTFGGHPVTSAAALATLQVLETEQLVAQVPNKANYMRSILPHPKIRNIRQEGLWFACELRDFDQVWEAAKAGVDRFEIFFDWFLFESKCIRLAPPLIITKEQIKWAVRQLHALLDAID